MIHSATKYLGGHNDLLAGTITGAKELVEPIRRALGVLGGIIDSHAAWLLLRGLKTLALRMDRHNSNGMALAQLPGSPPQGAQGLVPRPREPSRPRDRRAAR